MGRTVSYSVVKRNNPLDQDAVLSFMHKLRPMAM